MTATDAPLGGSERPMTETRTDAQHPVPDRVTMPLLTLITQQSLDEDYQHVADRRARMAEPPGRRGSGRRTAAVIALFGVIVTTAAVQTSRDSSSAASGRASLVAEAKRRNAEVAEQESQLRTLRQQLVTQQGLLDGVTADQQAVQTQLERLRVSTGYEPVTGPGVRVNVDDAPDGDDAGRIRDEDLAMLVDGLWNAGAEAIAVNGIRLTALSPIRSSGIAIHVNNRPISPPYVVLAIGDRSNLQSRFAETTHGLEWESLVNTFNFSSDMQNEDQLELPGARLPQLRAAQLLEDDSQTGKPEDVP
ncbi:conserved hypothetical protein [metagenome]|uniref:DUF881 domain-containing protein n=1 Tax=metagenome TaxID=256318 RepID=A0A2P2CDP8_9ZZZZ